MIREGDIVIIKHPDLSTWRDTEEAIEDGTLKLNVQYEVTRVEEDYDGLGPSVWLELPSRRGRLFSDTWGLSLDCVELVHKERIKRNLPEWW